jgi:two-component system response regulator HydG
MQPAQAIAAEKMNPQPERWDAKINAVVAQSVQHSDREPVDLAARRQDKLRGERVSVKPVSHRASSPPFDGELVQVSPVMREIVESIALVARSNTPVLILGESGTGKERVARAIHAGGSRANQPFVAVNASAIPEQLLESEVFGHVRGAFTGATLARRGLLMEAHGGTLLLDEIGDLPLMLQPKLLRLLQFGETRPVGGDRTGQVDVRVIAATHRNLRVLVRDGLFREDLLYRLNVIPILVPPLRDRREDILPLVTRFLQEAQDRNVGSPVTSISDEAMNVLNQAPWPGNIRELENTIERLVVLGRDAVVNAGDLAFLQEKAPEKSPRTLNDASYTLKEMNQLYLQRVLARTNGDKVRAAEILNINLSTLYRWERAKG